MYKEHRGGSFDRQGGGGSFRGKGSFDRGFGGRDAGRSAMHAATCAACGQACEVPFKPNGRKPVYCSNCFKKEGSTEPQRFGGMDAPRPAFRENREPRFGGNESVADNKGMEQIKKQLELVNAKLETLIQVLSPKSVKTAEKVVEKDINFFETPAREKKEMKKKKAIKK